MLEVENLSKSYGSGDARVDVLRGVSMSAAAGESLALVGESGCGKTTLMHLIAGLDAADSGHIRLAGTDVTALDDSGRAALRRERLGLVFQQYNLIPSLNVADNMAFQARLAGRDDPDWLAHLIQTLGLSGLEKRLPEQLSGGQQQRVAIARTLALKPDLILADEPTGNLDEATSDTVLDLCLALIRQTGCSFLLVTHSSVLAARLDRRLTLSDGHIHEVSP